jgi:hypothetical protein
MGDPERLREAFSLEYQRCRGLGAEVAAALLDRARRDVERDGPVAALLAVADVDATEGQLPLRLLAAVHHAVLSGRAPELEAHFPTTGGRPDLEAVGDLLVGLVERDAEGLHRQLLAPLRTNEVARAAVLFTGLMTIWQRTGLPMRLYELGASAGLCLQFDRFRYRLGIFEWGDADSPVRLHPRWSGDFLPEPETPLVVAEREGVDLAPIDVRDPAEALRLCSYVWPDDPDRLDRLRAAISLARQHPVPVTRDDALDWLADKLETVRPGVGTVVFHSHFEASLVREERAELAALLEEAAKGARIGQPLAWLRLEPEDQVLRLRLQIWPAGRGRDELLAEAHPHCRWIQWHRRGIRPLIEEMDD